MSVRRWLVIAVGALLALIGLASTGAGAVIAVTYQVHHDRDGYLTTPVEPFRSATSAITSGDIELDLDPDGDSFVPGELGRVRVRVEAADGEPVFVGIARAADVERYLGAVAHDELVHVDLDPFDPEYRRVPGAAMPDGRPGDDPIWAVSSAGPGRQDVVWEVEDGEWRLVVMNVDGSPGIDVRADVGGTASWILPVALALLAGGFVVLALGTLALLAGAHGAAAGVPLVATHPPVLEGRRPVRLVARLDEPLSRWRWLVKWFLAIPHVVVLAPLWVAFVVTTIAAFCAVVVTGRYPRRLFDFNVGVLRWTWRVGFYAFTVIGTDAYPPFSLDPDPSYPADLTIEHPAQLSRTAPLYKWLLAVPHYLVVGVLTGGVGLHWGGVVGVLVLVAGVVLLATGSYPRSLFDVLLGCSRWSLRMIAYAALLRDEYPPFRFDGGGDADEEVPT